MSHDELRAEYERLKALGERLQEENAELKSNAHYILKIRVHGRPRDTTAARDVLRLPLTVDLDALRHF